MEYINGRMGEYMRGSFIKIIDTAEESCFSKMVPNLMENGKIISNMAAASSQITTAS